MKLPKYLVDSDPLLTNVTLLEGLPQPQGVEISDDDWTAEELENAERQVKYTK